MFHILEKEQRPKHKIELNYLKILLLLQKCQLTAPAESLVNPGIITTMHVSSMSTAVDFLSILLFSAADWKN